MKIISSGGSHKENVSDDTKDKRGLAIPAAIFMLELKPLPGWCENTARKNISFYVLGVHF